MDRRELMKVGAAAVTIVLSPIISFADEKESGLELWERMSYNERCTGGYFYLVPQWEAVAFNDIEEGDLVRRVVTPDPNIYRVDGRDLDRNVLIVSVESVVSAVVRARRGPLTSEAVLEGLFNF